jgi:cytochrome o ubiquinol oxidase subunit II
MVADSVSPSPNARRKISEFPKLRPSPRARAETANPSNASKHQRLQRVIPDQWRPRPAYSGVAIRPRGHGKIVVSEPFEAFSRGIPAMPSWRGISGRCGLATPLAFAAFLAPKPCLADSILAPAGPVSAGDALILLDATVIMLAIVIPTMLATLAFAWWYRASNTRAAYRPDWTYSGRIELLVWSVPTLVIFFLGGVIWIGSHQLDPFQPLSRAKPLEIEVVALDWKWLFIYPQQNVASINELVIPVGTPVHFRLTSASVFNIFFVPRLGSQIYAMNGMTSQLNLQADKPGNYLGLSAHYSGDGFSNMHFATIAEPQAQFAQWIARAQANGPMLDMTAYRGLLKQDLNLAPHTYRGVQPGLFDAVAMQKLPPGEGPQTGRNEPGTSSHGGT